MLIYCPKCEAANNEDAVACSSCGHRLIASSKRPPDPAPRIKSKSRQLPRCRECGHPVARSAKTCPSCGAPNPATSKTMQIATMMICAIGVVGMILVCSGILNSGGGTEVEVEGDQKSTAFVMVQQYAEERLVSPATADWPWTCETVTYLGDGRYRVLTYVDSQNAFGALIRSNVDAVVKWMHDDVWVLKSLSIE